MKINWSTWLAQQDQRIRSAQSKHVVTDLRALNLKKIPREYIASLADIGRRLSLSHWMLRLLNPYINPIHGASSASAREQALYAVALARIGAHKESAYRISKIADQSKEVLILKASAWISLRNYRQAQIIYKILLKLETPTDYERRIAEINLAACYVNQGHYAAALTQLKSFSQWKETFPLVYGNSRELMAQAFLGLDQYRDAERMAIESNEALRRGVDVYSLFARKWLLIIQSLASGRIPKEEWRIVQDRAVEGNDGETLRDLALFQSVITQSTIEFSKVYIGTPFESYRKTALKRFKKPVVVPSSYLVKPEDANATAQLDLKTGIYKDSQKEITITGKKLEILRILNRDFFRSVPTGELFSFLYPDEVFNVSTSHHRVYQLVFQLKKYLKIHQVPIQIVRAKHLYRLKTDSVGILVYQKYTQDIQRKNQLDETIVKALTEWLQGGDGKPFQRADLEKYFSFSKTTSIKWLKVGRLKKLFTSRSAGNRSLYFPSAALTRTRL